MGIKRLAGDQMNQGKGITGRNTLGELKAVEVVAVFKGTQVEVNLGTQGVENWRRRIAIQGLQVACPPRWRRKAAMELM